MFLEHFGLIEQPFGVTPDPRFLHMGPKHREALASLVYGTETNRGFLALIAQPGMGKTSLLYQYLEGLRNKSRAAFIFQTDCDSEDFIRHILIDLTLDLSGKDLPTMHAMLNEVLLAEMRAGRRFILVIDEAQNLNERVLESVRLLSNFETPWMKLMQIVIAGQPQLAERLTRPSMAQLRQRISSVIRIDPFTPGETNDYIDHRLWVAGYSRGPLFTVGARLMIAKQSGGIPRNINRLCFNAMSVAYGMGGAQVDAKMVREVADDLNIESLVPKLERTPSRVAGSGRTFVPFRAGPPKKEQRRVGPLVPAFASFCALLLLATCWWMGLAVGTKTPPFDLLIGAWTHANWAGPSGDQLQAAIASAPATADPIAMETSESVAHSDISAEAAKVGGGSSADGASASSSNAAGTKATVADPATQTFTTKPVVHAVPSDSSIPAGLSDNDRILTVAVEKEVTLLDLSFRHLGRFDETTLEKTLALNPSLTDVNHIEAGQRIRLPLYLRVGFVDGPGALGGAETIDAQKERP